MTAAESLAARDPFSHIRRFETRFLYVFSYEESRLAAAKESLSAASILGLNGVWSAKAPRPLYVEELHQHVAQFLFPERDDRSAYLAVETTIAEKWFQDIELRREGMPPIGAKLSEPRIELFLSYFGVGILSIALSLDSPSRDACATFNYRLSQLRPQTAPQLRSAHPSDDPAKWEKIKDKIPKEKQQVPAADSPIAERVGVRGGSFSMAELVAALLKPLEPAPMQPGLSLYTVAQFDDSINLASDSLRGELAPFLSGLAQIEEAQHAGSASLDLPSAHLNRNHWTAVSNLGAAHLIADQPAPSDRKEHPFNAQRMQRVRDKYFVAFLVALMQKLVALRILDDAAAIVGERGEEGRAALARIRTSLLEFAVRGQFTQVSSRASLHRFYALAQSGLEAQATLENTRRALAELDARNTSENEARLAEDNARNGRTLVGMQKNLEFVEAFIAGVYGVHLLEMVTNRMFEPPAAPPRAPATAGLEYVMKSPWTAGIVFVLVALIAWFVFSWGHRATSRDNAHE